MSNLEGVGEAMGHEQTGKAETMTTGQGSGGRDMAAASGWTALVAALLASSCCVLPLLLFFLGITGAWIGNLTALAPYKPAFLGFAVLMLAIGFYQIHFRRPVCADGDACSTPASQRVTRIVLWISAALTLLAAIWDWLVPLILG